MDVAIRSGNERHMIVSRSEQLGLNVWKVGTKQGWVALLGVCRFRGRTDKPYRPCLCKPVAAKNSI